MNAINCGISSEFYLLNKNICTFACISENDYRLLSVLVQRIKIIDDIVQPICISEDKSRILESVSRLAMSTVVNITYDEHNKKSKRNQPLKISFPLIRYFHYSENINVAVVIFNEGIRLFLIKAKRRHKEDKRL